jgi:hypothetical protein
MSQLRFRLFQDDDLQGLQRLWEQTDWCPDDGWSDWYLSRHLYGQPIVAVALDEQDEIAAQLEFQSCLVQIGEQETRAVRLAAAILRQDLRSRQLHNLSHPMLQLFRVGMEAAVSDGYHLLFATPHVNWLPVLQWANRMGVPSFQIMTQACQAALIDSAEGATVSPASVLFGGGRFIATQGTEFGVDYDALWRRARLSLPVDCAVVRSVSWLNAHNRGKIIIEIRDAHSCQLIGYTAVRRHDGLIFDVLAGATTEFETVLAGTRQWVSRNRAAAVSADVKALKVLALPIMEPALRSVGFEEDPYVFAFACSSLDSVLSPAAISPEKWYIAAGD